jgi:hypothetical protein
MPGFAVKVFYKPGLRFDPSLLSERKNGALTRNALAAPVGPPVPCGPLRSGRTPLKPRRSISTQRNVQLRPVCGQQTFFRVEIESCARATNQRQPQPQPLVRVWTVQPTLHLRGDVNQQKLNEGGRRDRNPGSARERSAQSKRLIVVGECVLTPILRDLVDVEFARL